MHFSLQTLPQSLFNADACDDDAVAAYGDGDDDDDDVVDDNSGGDDDCCIIIILIQLQHYQYLFSFYRYVLNGNCSYILLP